MRETNENILEVLHEEDAHKDCTRVDQDADGNHDDQDDSMDVNVDDGLITTKGSWAVLNHENVSRDEEDFKDDVLHYNS